MVSCVTEVRPPEPRSARIVMRLGGACKQAEKRYEWGEPPSEVESQEVV